MELGAHRFLSYFPAATIGALSKNAVDVVYPDGATIFEEGEYPDCLYLVIQGKVDLSKKTSGGRHQHIAQLAPGDYFGELGVLDGLPRSARATASGECRLAKISRDAFLRILKDVPAQTVVDLMMQLIKNLRQTNDRFIYEVVRKERMTLLSEMAEAILRDFRTSFTIIHMVCSRVRNETGVNNVQELCDVVDDQLRIMSEMSEEVLTLSRGSITLAKQKVPLRNLFDRLIVLTKIILQEHKIRLNIEPTDAVLDADPDRMLRVLQALTIKAVENFRGQVGDITINIHRTNEGLDILIHDDGPVAAPDAGENFYEPLMTQGGIRETGMGVALAKFIVEAHGGRLFIESNQGRGTSFVLRFPAS